MNTDQRLQLICAAVQGLSAGYASGSMSTMEIVNEAINIANEIGYRLEEERLKMPARKGWSLKEEGVEE